MQFKSKLKYLGYKIRLFFCKGSTRKILKDMKDFDAFLVYPIVKRLEGLNIHISFSDAEKIYEDILNELDDIIKRM